MLPYYGMRMWRRGGYGRDFRYRLGLYPSLKKSEKKRIWLQAVSVGEVKAAESLIDRFITDGRFEVVLTTTSSTGYSLARDLYSRKILLVGLFPWDFCLFSMLAWRRICPDIVVLMEGELWPEHIHQASMRHVPIYLVNGRLSDKTFARYLKFSVLSRKIFSQITKILAQSKDVFNRFIELGIDKQKISVSGNLKFDCTFPQMDLLSKKKLKAKLGFSEDSLILLGSSTWPGEEEWLVECFREIRRQTQKDWRLLLVPRHAERRGEIVSCLKKSKFRWHQRSLGAAANQVDICLGDTTGELVWLTGTSDLAFVGKSLLGNSGGQSPLDAAAYGVPIVYGDSMTNFRTICQSLESAGGAMKAADGESAQKILIELACDGDKRANLARVLSDWYTQNRGATEYTYRTIIGDVFNGE